jgi:hypothetical protein
MANTKRFMYHSRPNELAALIHDSRTLITSIPKAKTAKISKSFPSFKPNISGDSFSFAKRNTHHDGVFSSPPLYGFHEQSGL